MRPAHRNITILTMTCVVAAALAGCSSTTGASTSEPSTVSSASQTPRPVGTHSPETTSTPAPASPSPVTSEGTGTAGRAPNADAERCTTDHLSGGFAGLSGTAGTLHAEIELTNTGSADCTLQGWPGVSLVGGGNGTQIGNPATEDTSSVHATVTLKPGTAAVADLSWTDAGTQNPASCEPKPGEGFRVYPPGSKTSLFVAHAGITGCASPAVTLFTIGALH